jgi:hypothetical protein
MSRILTIAGSILLILILAISTLEYTFPWVITRGYNYKYWNGGSALGWPDKEQPEFKQLNDRYGNPGNYATHGLSNDEIGVWVVRPLYDTSCSIKLSLFKNIKTKTVRMQAKLSGKTDPLNDGDPCVIMHIPDEHIQETIANWLSKSQLDKFSITKESGVWKPIKYGISYTPQPPIVLLYGD